jgi:hypothetical protein
VKTNQEMLLILKGSLDDKKLLFDELIEKANSESGLEGGEIVVLEALKKDLFKPRSIIVEMGVNLKGAGGVSS